MEAMTFEQAQLEATQSHADILFMFMYGQAS